MREIDGRFYEEKAPHDFEELKRIIEILRRPDIGCPWDKEQTQESLKECLKDEVEEVLQAIDAKDQENLCEELGDVLLQLLLMAQIGKEKKAFTFDDVVQGLSEKMIRRHPYVFGDMTGIETAEDTKDVWKKIKSQEK